jgi:glycerol-3-phosphate acyltransferase PlsY
MGFELHSIAIVFSIALAFGYLLGSIPFGLILTKLVVKKDVRDIGSGNIGATNVLRTGNKPLAAATLLLDGGKGAVAFLILTAAAGPVAGLIAGFGAMLGHCYPVWLKFKGGKGVATYFGLLWAIYWVFGVLFAVVWILIAILTRYSSLSALTASLCVTISSLVFMRHTEVLDQTVIVVNNTPYIVFLFPATLLIFWKHKDNIIRLSKGTESKIGHKS